MMPLALRPYELSDRVDFFRLVAEEDVRREEPSDEAQAREGFLRVLPGGDPDWTTWAVVATAHPDNGASVRVLEKNGFIFQCQATDDRGPYLLYLLKRGV